MIYAQGNPFEYIPQPVAGPNTPETTFIVTPLGWVTIIANILSIAVFALSVVSIVVSGIRFAVSRGDIKATQTAKAHLMYSIVAMVGSVAAYTILVVLKNALNVTYPAPFTGFF